MSDAVWEQQIAAPVGVHSARVENVDESGIVTVHVCGGRAVRARYVGTIHPDQLRAAAASGADVIVALADGDAARPVILGILADPATAAAELESETCVEIDGKRLALTGREEVTLRCGKASVTLTKAGKIIVRGTYLLSRSSGVNRIKGGSVQIN